MVGDCTFEIVERHNFNTLKVLNAKGEIIKKMIMTNQEIDNLEQAIRLYKAFKLVILMHFELWCPYCEKAIKIEEIKEVENDHPACPDCRRFLEEVQKKEK